MRLLSPAIVAASLLSLALSACSENPHVKVSDPPRALVANAQATQPVAPVTTPTPDAPATPPGDRDQDGVPDSIDQCPEVPGPAQNNGCPLTHEEDSDQDGVPDTDDRCPMVRGPAENHGCPIQVGNDRDGDWVADENDKCPTTPGPIFNQGCPLLDSDGDGLSDRIDECPLVPGPASNKGCALESDRDGDWVVDDEDRCPSVRGPIFNHGCPLSEREEESDADGDGVLDSEDQCKYLPGPAANYGCPYPRKEELEILREVRQTLNFDFDRATIRPSSFPALERLANFLKRHSGATIKMVGHTDDVGTHRYNQALSEARVRSVRAFLVSQGVAGGRIQIGARGESEPVVSVARKSGRALEHARARNRRVDMRVTYSERVTRERR